ncbi:MAG: MBL fold metallo-hydrolase [Candidatus Symbiothrix sp.]|jgi:phosphoribosyl 1,2-cyclic phosphate phosphodiesterase|nr:MBL fold metallo-hydrolase [Candidatus Symbiothrix sp.]
MKIRFLGTGTSTGVPEIGCRCDVCLSTDPRDKRLRTSLLVEIDGKHLLLDCGPDFRQQILTALESDYFDKLDGVLLTHEHYDHVGGLDDLRAFSKTEALNIYAEDYVAEAIKLRIPYAFRENKYPGVPNLNLVPIENKPFTVSGIEIIPVRLLHGNLPILGYRIGHLAYLTDLKTIPEEEYAKLHDLDVLVINALHAKEHLSHENIDAALANIARIQPKRAFLIHTTHKFGSYAEMQPQLPKNVFIAYDGLELSSR